MKGRKWRDDEILYLRERYGVMPTANICKRLGRSKDAVKRMVHRLGLGRAADSGEFLTSLAARRLLGVSGYMFGKWLTLGLKTQKRVLSHKCENRLVLLSDLCDFLRDNQDIWDSRKLELYALGEEPGWLTEKRRADAGRSRRKYKKWTPEDDRIAVAMYYNGAMYKDIGARLDRTGEAVRSRLINCLIRITQRRDISGRRR